MEIDDLLSAMDRTAANLVKLEEIWGRASPLLPKGPSAGSSAEYDELCRAWRDLLPGLPKIDGWTVTDELPDADDIGRSFIDYFEIGENPFPVYEELERPDKELAEYKFRLNRARRRAVRDRVEKLAAKIDASIDAIVRDTPRSSNEKLDNTMTDAVRTAIGEIERMIGDSAARQGRWGDLHRHLRFSEGHDWHDIKEFDWPSVRIDIQAATFTDTDPLPVPNIDLGVAAGGELTGDVATALEWGRLDDSGFERLLFDLLRAFPEHKNVQWLMQTRAADRGRDLSMDRVLSTSTGTIRSERVIVQAKHWASRSVNPTDVSSTVTSIQLWQPPLVRGLIIATTGRFTADAVAWIEQHNERGAPPLIECWPDSTLEALLAQKSHIAAAHGLR